MAASLTYPIIKANPSVPPAMKQYMSQALSPMISSKQTGRCATSRNNRRNMTNCPRATTGHRCNNSTAVGLRVTKERCNKGAPSVEKDLVTSGSVLNNTDTKKGCYSETISSLDTAKNNLSNMESLPQKPTSKRGKQRRCNKILPPANTTSDTSQTSPHSTKLKLSGSKCGKWREGEDLANGDCLSSAMEDSGRGNELSSSYESDLQIKTKDCQKFCVKQSGVQSSYSTCYSDADEDLFEDALSNLPSENEKSSISSSAFLTPLSIFSRSPPLLLPQTGSEGGLLANNEFVHCLTNSLQAIVVEQASANRNNKDSNDNTVDVLSDATNLLKAPDVVNGCAGNGSDEDNGVSNLLLSGTKGSRGNSSGGHPKSLHKKRLKGVHRPKTRKGDHGCDSHTSHLDLTMMERRVHGGKQHRNKGVFDDPKHATNSHQENKSKPPQLFVLSHERKPFTQDPKPIRHTVGFNSVSSASPASSVCSYSPPTLSPSPTSFHSSLTVETPSSQPTHILENIANLNHTAKPEDTHEERIKDAWPDFGVDVSAKLPQAIPLYGSENKADEPTEEDLLCEPPIVVTTSLPCPLPEELDSGCNFSISSSNESASSSLARENEPASSSLARENELASSSASSSLARENELASSSLARENESASSSLARENGPASNSLERKNESASSSLARENEPASSLLERKNEPVSSSLARENAPTSLLVRESELASTSLVRQNKPASILLARQSMHESCGYAPMCNARFQSTPQHQHQQHLSPDQYLQFQSHQLNIFVKQHQEQKEKQTDKHIFFSFDPPPLLNISPTGHLPVAPLQMVPSPPTILRPLFFSPPPVHVHPARPDIRTRLPCHTFSCPPPPPPPLPPNLPYKTVTSSNTFGNKEKVFPSDRLDESQSRADDAGHPLSDTWVMWFDRITGTSRNQCSNYQASLNKISTISSIEQFWQVYNNIPSPKDMAENSNLHYFKRGIQPLWEDPANQDGGKWVLTIKNDTTGLSKCWMEVLLLLVGGGVEKGHLINGAVMSRRKKGDRVALWTSTRDVDSNLDICTDLMRAVLLAYNISSEEMGSFMKQLSKDKHGRSLVFMYHSDALISGHSYQNSVHIKMADHIDVILQELKKVHYTSSTNIV